MRKVLWIVLLAAAAIPMFSEQASAQGWRYCGTPVYCAPSPCYAAPVYYASSVCYAPSVSYAPRVVYYSYSPYGCHASPVRYYFAPAIVQPMGTAEPRPTGPPKE